VREAEEREELKLEDQEAAEKVVLPEEMTDEEICEKLELPNPDDLEEGADFKPFLSSVVPERLRRRALRRLWTLNPTLANVDGLVEYGEDFTDAATVIEGLQTTYQVGKGMLKHIEKLAEEAEALGKEPEDDDAKSGNEIEESAEEEAAIASLAYNAEPPLESPMAMSLTDDGAYMHNTFPDSADGDGSDDREDEHETLEPDVPGVRGKRMRFSFS